MDEKEEHKMIDDTDTDSGSDNDCSRDNEYGYYTYTFQYTPRDHSKSKEYIKQLETTIIDVIPLQYPDDCQHDPNFTIAVEFLKNNYILTKYYICIDQYGSDQIFYHLWKYGVDDETNNNNNFKLILYHELNLLFEVRGSELVDIDSGSKICTIPNNDNAVEICDHDTNSVEIFELI
jgi:hypothetical protein